MEKSKKKVLSTNVPQNNAFFQNIPVEKAATAQYSSILKTKSNELYVFGLNQGQFGLENQDIGSVINTPKKIPLKIDGNIIGFSLFFSFFDCDFSYKLN